MRSKDRKDIRKTMIKKYDTTDYIVEDFVGNENSIQHSINSWHLPRFLAVCDYVSY